MSKPWNRPPGIPKVPIPIVGPSKPKKGTATAAGRARRAQAPLDPSVLFLEALRQRQLPNPHREPRFHATRLWRFDYAWPAWSLALEVDGGIWRQGRHTRGAGWLKDTEKLNCAASMGWRLLRCTPQMLCTEEFLAVLKAALQWHAK